MPIIKQTKNKTIMAKKIRMQKICKAIKVAYGVNNQEAREMASMFINRKAA